MRSSARVRVAVGHGKNRDPAFDTPLPPSSLFPLLPPSTLATFSESLNSIDPQREKSKTSNVALL